LPSPRKKETGRVIKTSNIKVSTQSAKGGIQSELIERHFKKIDRVSLDFRIIYKSFVYIWSTVLRHACPHFCWIFKKCLEQVPIEKNHYI